MTAIRGLSEEMGGIKRSPNYILRMVREAVLSLTDLGDLETSV